MKYVCDIRRIEKYMTELEIKTNLPSSTFINKSKGMKVSSWNHIFCSFLLAVCCASIYVLSCSCIVFMTKVTHGRGSLNIQSVTHSHHVPTHNGHIIIWKWSWKHSKVAISIHSVFVQCPNCIFQHISEQG